MRRDVLAAQLREILPPDDVVICGLGTASRTWRNAGAENLCYYISDPMGIATGFALGFALARPSLDVLLMVGDGDLLMNLGALTDVSEAAPANLRVVVLFNGKYETGGGARLAAEGRVDFAGIARASSFERQGSIFRPKAKSDVRPALEAMRAAPGPGLVVVDVEPEPSPYAPEGPWAQVERKAIFQHRLKARLVERGEHWLDPTA